ncbi:hypothetical protein ABZX95_44065 [Streptomyces sp. NPDC004232]|uniref:hypothetical protein n=1 Tax=Streptomyces sp. NPDC004232 TaxID=3154454 RepID=UPI0033BD7B13
MGAALKDGKLGGGPVTLIVASLVSIPLCGSIWVLLVLRAVSLYVGALLGVVYGGLVDKDLWGHVRRWAAVMIGLILIEPITVIILGLSNALESSSDHGTIATGIAVSLIAIGANVFLVARTAGGAGRVATGTVGAVVGVQQGINTHSNRGSSGGRVNGTSTPKVSNPATGGIGAHGNRKPKPPKND